MTVGFRGMLKFTVLTNVGALKPLSVSEQGIDAAPAARPQSRSAIASARLDMVPTMGAHEQEPTIAADRYPGMSVARVPPVAKAIVYPPEAHCETQSRAGEVLPRGTMTAVESSARRTHIAVVDPKYSPACGQGAVHASALVAPTVAEYLPVLQLVQADEPESAYVFVGQ
jgi:hypothetical protein